MIELFMAGWLASYIAVALKAMQQLNVVHGRYLWVIPFSYGMAYAETYITEQVATHGANNVAFAVGTGAWMGCVTSMWLNSKLRGE